MQRTTSYRYDSAGNRITEWYQDASGTIRYQDTHTSYDALGRIDRVREADYATTYGYDAAGNRRRIYTQYLPDTVSGAAVSQQDKWYTYDAQNRITQAGSTTLACDGAGNRSVASVSGGGYDIYLYNQDRKRVLTPP